jgi:hypothetical protein
MPLTRTALPFRYAPRPRSLPHQRYLRGEHRVFAHEGLGAVDGIHQPQVFGIRIAAAGLLAEESVGGKALLENLANRDFTAYIRLGYRRLIRLDAHLDIALEHRTRDFRGLLRGIERRLQFRRGVHVRHHIKPGAHAAAFNALIRASHRLDVWLGGTAECVWSAES